MAESRLSIVIDSRSAEQKAQDVKRALQALEDAGVRVTGTTEAVSSGMARQAQQSQLLSGRVNNTRDAMRRMAQAQNAVRSGQKGLFQPVQAERYAASANQAAGATENVSRSYKSARLSAAQLAQANRQLPAQFTDIFTSLASGQPVMQVFLQQGGQIKDAYGGVGPALRGVAGYVRGLVNPFTIAAAAVGTLVLAYEQGRREQQAFANTLILTGNEAGTTAGQMSELAAQMDELAGVTQRSASRALNEVAQSGKFTAEQFEMVTSTALRMQQATGRAIEDTIKEFGKIADDPVDAIAELNDQYNFLTPSVYDNIRALERSGDTIGAAELAMESYADAMDQRSRDIGDNLGTLERIIDGVTTSASEMWNALLDVGRKETLSERIASTQRELDELNSMSASYGAVGAGNVGSSAERRILEARLATLQALNLASEAGAEAQRRQNEETQRHIEMREREDRIERETLSTRQRIAEVDSDIAFIRERMAEATTDADRSRYQEMLGQLEIERQGIIESTDAYRERERAQREAERQAERLIESYNREAQSLDRQIALYGQTGEAAKVRYEIEHGALQGVSELRKQQLIQRAEELDRIEDEAKAQEEYREQVESLLDTYGGHRRRLIELRQAVVTLNRAFSDPSVEMSLEEYRTALAGIQEEMRQVALESDPLAQDMARAWERAAERIDETFADAFTGAFDSFDDFADQLLDGFKRLLGELAYQAALRPIVVGFTQSMGGAMGIPGMGGAGAPSLTGGLGQVSSFFTGNSIGQGISSAAQGLYGAATGNTVAYGGSGWAGQVSAGNAGWLNNPAGISNISYGLQSFGGGYVGTELGSSLTGRTANSNYGAMAGSIAGSFLPIPGGTFIGATIGGFLDSLFGSGEKTFDFDFVQGEQPGVFGDRESALGQFGIERFSDFKLGEQQDQLNALMTSIAEFDNVLASVAIPERVEAMRESIEGFTHSGPETLFEERLRAIVDGSGILMEEALGEIADPQRLAEAVTGVLRLEALGVALGDSLMAGVTEELERYAGTERFEGAVVSMTNAAEAAALLQSSSERLGLTWRDTADGAIHAAGLLAEMAGGVSNLAGMQQAYYQAYYSEAERVVHMQEDVTAAFAELGYALPESRDQLRAMIEAQDLNTEAGREAYIELLSLAGGFDQLQQALESTGSTIDSLLSPVRSAWDQLNQAVDDERQILREAHAAATASIRDNMSTVSESMRRTEHVANSLRGALDSMLGSSNSLGEMQRRQAQLLIGSIVDGGGLGDPRELERALSVVSRPSEELYGSFAEYERDFLATANDIAELSERAGDQLTTEEATLAALERQLRQQDTQYQRELRALDEQLEAQREQLEAEFGQLDWLETVNGSVLSVSEAIAHLGNAITDALAAGAGGSDRSDNVSSGNDAEGNPLASGATGPIADLYREILGRDPDYAGLDYYRNSGMTLEEIRAALLRSSEYDRYISSGLPGYADGGIAAGPTSGYPVELHGVEAVVPLKGGNIPVSLSMPPMPSSDGSIVREFQRLNKQIEVLNRRVSDLQSSNAAIARYADKQAYEAERMRRMQQQEETV
ncbi:phage tail length tape measure family protein [Halomonas pacifica]|uniref:phage tail length tape measure family protein n=1 Tax=Bisbaumannia pacifica TaxID=77098 RepID=UPI002358A03C|nr:phage tail length tape measure family protein [Halomonas pacifica]MDC8803951.1 phage tail length tape measure family protein [Halomonas pacifica]